MATGSGGSLPAMFAGTAYYGDEPTPELALAPVGRPAEAVSSAPSEVVARTDGTEVEDEEEETDIDAIARQVYPILKRRLAIERERMQGLA